jgi:glycosyltransferase involved in cell wall biosynthesis
MNRITTKLINLLNNFKNRLNCKVWSDKSMVVYAGATHYEWSALSLKTGIGGSEMAVIELGKEWAKLGYQVTVYNNCGSQAGIYDGVEYIQYSKFNKYDTFDTLIIWRYPWRLYPHTKAKRIWLDLHEVRLPEEVTAEKLKKFDKIFVKSQYHRSRMPEIEDERIRIITNGIDPIYCQLFGSPKDPYKLIYASDYGRGLESMLTYGWPIIKREIPEAHLHIYYGWPALNPKKPNQEDQVGSLAWQEKMIKLINQPGVTEHGRIGVADLMQEKATSAIHYYAATVREVDCITVRESALVGCIPVTTDFGALSERSYCIKVPGNPYKQKTHEEVGYKIVELLKDRAKLENLRQQFRELAQQETWENIAKVWLLP